jgi:trk system potassium uptake protein TrkA
MKDPDYIVIVGCGRLGSYLANALSRAGRSVVVVDRSEDAFAGLAPEFSGFRVAGDAVELETLKSANADRAGCLLAVAQDDNVNLMVAQVARQVFEVPRVIARVSDPAREAAFRNTGVDTVSPTALAGASFLRSLAPVGDEEARP